MRLWSIHPKHLDSKRLVALWREALLAKAVLEGKTKGYKNHPQLTRFKVENGLECLNLYLEQVYNESLARGYKFDVTKFKKVVEPCYVATTTGQLEYEQQHLEAKIGKKLDNVEPFPFHIVQNGPIEPWEKV